MSFNYRLRPSGRLGLLLALTLPLFACAGDTGFSVAQMQKLVAPAEPGGWMHKTFSSMEDNRFMTSFKSEQHAGKLAWTESDLEAGKIPVARAMQLAKDWCDEQQPFGEADWQVDSVTLQMRSTSEAIEYLAIVNMKTADYKTIEVLVLPNLEVLPPELNPVL